MVHFNSRCHRQWRREGGGGGTSAPGQLWGPGPSWICFNFFLIGSQWGIQDFDKGGGGHLKNIVASLRSAGFDCDYSLYYTYTHTNTCTHKIIAIFRGRGEG